MKKDSLNLGLVSEVGFRVLPSLLIAFVEGIKYLRPINHKEIREPKLVTDSLKLREDASNLIPYLYSHKDNEDLQEVMEKLFPGTGLKLEVVQGYAFLTLKQGDLEIDVKSVPDGLLKLIAVTLVVSGENNSIVLIDELENSMHARMLGVVYDLINAKRFPTLIATHSPLLVNLAGPERVTILKKEGYATRKAEYKPEEIKKKLVELGLDFSDIAFEAEV